MSIKSCVVIEITASQIKFLQSSTDLITSQLVHCDVQSVCHLSDQEIALIIKRWFQFRSIRLNTCRIIAVVPQKNVILRFLNLPSNFDDELKKMVELQIASQIPFARNEVVYNYNVIKKNVSGHSKILCSIIPKEGVQRLIEIFNLSGFSLQEITTSALGIYCWYLNFGQDNAIVEGAASLLISFDDHSAEACFLTSDAMVFARDLGVGLENRQIKGAKEFIRQVDLTIQSYQREKIVDKIDKIVILSAASGAFSIKEEVEKEYNVPVLVRSPLQGIVCHKDFKWPSMVLSGDCSMAASNGLIYSKTNQFSNFLPSDVLARVKNIHRRSEWIRLGVLLMLAACIGTAAFRVGDFKKEKFLNKLEQQAKESQVLAKIVIEKIKSIEKITAILNKRIYFSNLINELYRVMPTDIFITSLRLTNNNLTVQGYSQEAASINNLQEAMLSSKLFNIVALDFVNKRKSIDGEVSYFKVTSQIGSAQ